NPPPAPPCREGGRGPLGGGLRTGYFRVFPPPPCREGPGVGFRGTTMIKPLAYFSVLALVVCGALVHGAATQRWGGFTPHHAQTARLHATEVRFEDWQPTEVPPEMPLNERSTATSRRYVSASGRTAVVSFISGIPGSVATHTPDVCYPSSGYKALRGVRKENF